MQKKTGRARKGGAGRLLIVFAVLLIIASVLYIVNYYAEKKRTSDTTAALAALYRDTASTPTVMSAPTPASTPMETAVAQTSPSPVPSSSPTPPAPSPVVLAYPTPPSEIAEGFKALYDINPDVVGRLYLPSATTPIELFVVQRDNEYYLKHDFYGAEDDAGTLFLDEINEIWPQDQHMIIYGHNMKNGTMFARLTKYKALAYAANNPLAYFDTLYESGVYVVFAAMRLTEAESLSEEFNVRTVMFGENGFMSFVNAIRARALYVTSVDMNEFDQLLTLITCSYNKDDERFLLVLRRLREDETEADIRALAGKK